MKSGALCYIIFRIQKRSSYHQRKIVSTCSGIKPPICIPAQIGHRQIHALTTSFPSHVHEIWATPNRNNQTLRSLQALISNGRLAGAGYVSILPVDRGVEHCAGASYTATNPHVFSTRENIVRLAIRRRMQCRGFPRFGVCWSSISRKYARTASPSS